MPAPSSSRPRTPAGRLGVARCGRRSSLAPHALARGRQRTAGATPGRRRGPGASGHRSRGVPHSAAAAPARASLPLRYARLADGARAASRAMTTPQKQSPPRSPGRAVGHTLQAWPKTTSCTSHYQAKKMVIHNPIWIRDILLSRKVARAIPDFARTSVVLPRGYKPRAVLARWHPRGAWDQHAAGFSAIMVTDRWCLPQVMFGTRNCFLSIGDVAASMGQRC
jgi:hypothetical protein